MPAAHTSGDGSKSTEVCTVTLKLLLVASPMVKPVIVTTNADAGMAAPAVVMTTAVAVVALHVPNNPTMLLPPAAKVGVMDGAKKPEGNLSVMVPPEVTAFAGVNPSVTGTAVLPALRSDTAILKYTSEMGRNSPPEKTEADGSMSVEA